MLHVLHAINTTPYSMLVCTTHTYTNSSMRSQIYLLPSHVHSVSVCVCVCFIYPNSHGVLICNVCGSLNQISIQFPFNAHAIYGPRRTGWCPIEALPRRVEKKVIIQLDIPNDFQFYPDDHDAEKNYTRQDIYESLIWLALARSASPWCCVSHGRTNIARVFLSATWFSLYVACPFEKHSPINRERERRER